jgi:hypothetical protein
MRSMKLLIMRLWKLPESKHGNHLIVPRSTNRMYFLELSLLVSRVLLKMVLLMVPLQVVYLLNAMRCPMIQVSSFSVVVNPFSFQRPNHGSHSNKLDVSLVTDSVTQSERLLKICKANQAKNQRYEKVWRQRVQSKLGDENSWERVWSMIDHSIAPSGKSIMRQTMLEYKNNPRKTDCLSMPCGACMLGLPGRFGAPSHIVASEGGSQEFESVLMGPFFVGSCSFLPSSRRKRTKLWV